jgi:hypothetical protein
MRSAETAMEYEPFYCQGNECEYKEKNVPIHGSSPTGRINRR